jgi:hypothetical protein
MNKEEPGMSDPTATSSRKWLLLDGDTIGEMRGLKRVFHSPTKHPDNPLVHEDHPWEHGTLYPCWVLRDDERDLFHMWYRAVDMPNGTEAPGEYGCYAYSDDGVRWTKPSLGRVEYRGSTDNNIIATNSPAAVMLNADPELTPQRYLAFWPGEQPFSLSFRASDDGIEWTKLSIPETGDLRHTPIVSNRSGKYYTTGQGWAGSNPWGGNRRGVMRCQSSDLATWEGRRIIFAAEEHGGDDLEFYTMDTAWRYMEHTYAGLHLGFLHCFHTDLDGRRNPVNHAAMSGTIDVSLAISRDTIDWSLPNDLEAFLPLGEQQDDFDTGMVFISSMIEYKDRLLFYYGGWNIDHGQLMADPEKIGRSDIGLAELRLDGFASVESTGDYGVMTTAPITISGTVLELNADAREGSVAVDIVGEDGSILRSQDDCSAIKADNPRQTVRWNGEHDLADLVGRTVRLRFGLTGIAKLYSFTISHRP